MNNYYNSELSRITAVEYAANIVISGGGNKTKTIDINSESLPYLVKHLKRLAGVGVDFERIKHDVNGNPRFRCTLDSFHADLDTAKQIAKVNGGRYTKSGFVFKCYEFQLKELSERLINGILQEAIK